uniref:Uncharacterized protein n=1 Tax=Arundo donax TaxID=35708 RepID=A0A0A8YD10_ARUDO
MHEDSMFQRPGHIKDSLRLEFIMQIQIDLPEPSQHMII